MNARQLGCYIPVNMAFGNLESCQDMLIDSGAQVSLLLPLRLLPPECKLELEHSKNLAGISGQRLPVAGTLMLDVTVGDITRETEAIILDETLDMNTGLVGLQFMVDFKLTINCGERSVQVKNKIIKSEFIELDELSRNTYQKALAAKLDISRLLCVKLHASARKIKDISSWVSDQFAYSSKLPLPILGGEDELILDDALESIKSLYNIPHGATTSDIGCQTAIHACFSQNTHSPESGAPLSDIGDDSASAAGSARTAGSTDDCRDCRAKYWDEIIDAKIIRPIVKKRILLSRLSSAEFSNERTNEFSTQCEEEYFEEINSADLRDITDVHRNNRGNNSKNSGSQAGITDSLHGDIEMQPERRFEIEDIEVRGETDEYMSILNGHSHLSIDEMVNLKRARCSQCSTDDHTITDTTLDLSIFRIKQEFTVPPRTAQTVSVYIKNESDPTHLGDTYFVPQQHLKDLPNLLVHDTICETHHENIHKIMLVNISDTPITAAAHTDLGLAIRLAVDKQKLPARGDTQTPPTSKLSVEQRHERLLSAINLDHLQEPQKGKVIDLIKEFHAVFYLAPEDYKLIEDVEYKINLKDHQRAFTPQFRLKPQDNIEMQKILDDMLAKQVIEKIDPNTDDFKYNSPAFLLAKSLPSGEKDYRLLIDQRKVNEKINVDSINSFFSTVTEQFHQLGDKNIFSCVDIKSAFFH